MPGSAALTSTASATQLELDLTSPRLVMRRARPTFVGIQQCRVAVPLVLAVASLDLTWSPVSGRPEVRYEFWAMNLAVVLIERRGRDEVSIQ